MNTTSEDDKFSIALRLLISLAAAGLVLYFMHLVSGLINNLFLAFMIAVIASPLLLWLREKGAPNWLAFVLTLAAVAVGALLLVAFIAYAASRLTLTIPTYIDDAQEIQDSLNNIVLNLGQVDLNFSAFLNVFELQKILQVAANFIGGVLGALGNVFIIILFVVFMLVQVFTTPVILRYEIAAGNAYLQRFVTYIINLRRYLLITAVIAVVTGGLDTLWFLILGIPNPIIWGGVAAIMSFVPTIGFWLAAIPPTLMALFEYGPATALITLAGILIINGFADNYVKPRYVGEGLDLAPFVVVFSVIFWAIVLGPVGAITGVPMTMLVKSLLLEADEDFDWVAHLMSSGLGLEEPPETLPESKE